MTELLERAMQEVEQLPEVEQDAITAVILEELHSEARWDAAFARSQEQLAQVAGDALAEYHAGNMTVLPRDRQ
jgi:hypothetical protein